MISSRTSRPLCGGRHHALAARARGQGHTTCRTVAHCQRACRPPSGTRASYPSYCPTRAAVVRTNRRAGSGTTLVTDRPWAARLGFGSRPTIKKIENEVNRGSDGSSLLWGGLQPSKGCPAGDDLGPGSSLAGVRRQHVRASSTCTHERRVCRSQTRSRHSCTSVAAATAR